MIVAQAPWRPGMPLTDVEEAMRACAEAGEVLDLLGAVDSPDTRAMRAWDESKTVRAGVLRHLLTQDEWRVDARGVRLRGLRITGCLDLEATRIRCPLRAESCAFDESQAVRLDFATAPLIVLTSCWMAGFSASGSSVAANLDLGCSEIDGPLVLNGASIGGGLVCGGTQLGADSGGNSFTGAGLRVRLSAYFGKSAPSGKALAAQGALRMPRADIGGQLDCRGAQLGANAFRDALDGRGLTVGGSVFLGGGFQTAGAVQLAGAVIQGQLSCQGAYLGANAKGYSLVGDVLRVHAGILLDPFPGGETFIAEGAVGFANATVTGPLNCRAAQLHGADHDGRSLDCQGMTVSGSVYLDRGFIARGAVWLAEATVSGPVRCSGASLGATAYGNSLECEGLRGGGGLDCEMDPDGRPFSAQGAVLLTGADITGSVVFSGARLKANKKDVALDGDELKVSVTVDLDQGFTATGAVRLNGAEIGGRLRCRGARIDGFDSDHESLRCGGPALAAP